MGEVVNFPAKDKPAVEPRAELAEGSVQPDPLTQYGYRPEVLAELNALRAGARLEVDVDA
jgi:hypothetical protein